MKFSGIKSARGQPGCSNPSYSMGLAENHGLWGEEVGIGAVKPRVLFVCVHNSARSQMAEAFLRHFCGDRFEVYSAGIEPGHLNPVAVKAMQEVGIDISTRRTKAVKYFVNGWMNFAYFITVCDAASAERCPPVPNAAAHLHWSFPDPSDLHGTRTEKLAKMREVRDAIRAKVEAWCAEVCPRPVA